MEPPPPPPPGPGVEQMLHTKLLDGKLTRLEFDAIMATVTAGHALDGDEAHRVGSVTTPKPRSSSSEALESLKRGLIDSLIAPSPAAKMAESAFRQKWRAAVMADPEAAGSQVRWLPYVEWKKAMRQEHCERERSRVWAAAEAKAHEKVLAAVEKKLVDTIMAAMAEVLSIKLGAAERLAARLATQTAAMLNTLNAVVLSYQFGRTARGERGEACLYLRQCATDNLAEMLAPMFKAAERMHAGVRCTPADSIHIDVMTFMELDQDPAELTRLATARLNGALRSAERSAAQGEREAHAMVPELEQAFSSLAAPKLAKAVGTFSNLLHDFLIEAHGAWANAGNHQVAPWDRPGVEPKQGPSTAAPASPDSRPAIDRLRDKVHEAVLTNHNLVEAAVSSEVRGVIAFLDRFVNDGAELPPVAEAGKDG